MFVDGRYPTHSWKFYRNNHFSNKIIRILKMWPNKFFDLSTPSMRKIDDGERKKKKKENNGGNSGH